jgi:alkaline phosphatase
MQRRDFLRRGAATLAGGAVGLTGCVPRIPDPGTPPRPELPVGRARNIIFFAYDGLTHEDLATGRYFAERQLDGGALELERVLARGASGMMLTHSLTSVVTDSAAASAAWATGRKVVNTALSMLPGDRPLTTILQLARDAGRAIGLVTTTRMTHATPAAWAVRLPDRDLEDEVAVRYLELAPEVLLGGGWTHFRAADRGDGRDLLAEYRARGYAVLQTPQDLASTNASRLLGTFAADHLPYEIDRRHQGVASPSLAEMTARGLEVLSGHDRGFVLQVEAGRIDHANHHNDPGAMVWDLLAADEALRVVTDFAERHPETLVILASDHGTGGGAVYGVGAGYRGSSPAFDRLGRQRASLDFLIGELAGGATPAAFMEAAERLFGVRVTPAQAEQGVEILARRLRLGHPQAHRHNPRNSLYQLLTQGGGAAPGPLNLSYATGAHTAGPVPLAVLGAGTGTAGLGVVDNTELFGWMTHALGIAFENPHMTEEEALRVARDRPAASRHLQPA